MHLTTLEDRAYQASLAKIIAQEKAASLVLKDALDDIRITMSKIYEKYAVGGVLSKAEMTRYNRLATAEAQIQEILDPALRKTRAIMNRVPALAYEEAFFRYAWAMDNGAAVRLKWGIVNMDQILANLANEMDKIAIETYGADARILVRKAINRGLPVGKSYLEMAKDLKTALETTNYNALRIIRTEGTTAMNAGQDAAYARAEDQGIEGSYVWDATLDGKTRPSHGTMDQKRRNEEGVFDGPEGEHPHYPGDEILTAKNRINCRCRLRFEVEGYSPLIRRTRDEGLVPYQDYATWKAGNEGTGPKIRYSA